MLNVGANLKYPPSHHMCNYYNTQLFLESFRLSNICGLS
jgi:hypothetical protein